MQRKQTLIFNFLSGKADLTNLCCLSDVIAFSMLLTVVFRNYPMLSQSGKEGEYRNGSPAEHSLDDHRSVAIYTQVR